VSSPCRSRLVARPSLALAIAATLTAVGCLAPPARAQWPTNGRALSTAIGDQSYPAILSDGVGGAFLVWEDRRGTTPDVYAQRVLPGGAIAAGWPVNGRAVCTAVLDQLAPVLAADGADGVFVAWEDYRAGGANPDIYVQRLTGSGAVASGWPANGFAICTQTNAQGRPTIVSDGAGGAIVAWEDFRSGATDVYAQRVDATGARLWTTNGVPLSTATGGQRFPIGVPDGAGGAIVAWEDTRTGDGDVYAQRVDGDGDAQWAADGVALCAGMFDQVGLRITTDGVGGAIVTWEDHRADNSDIYAQRVDPAGDPMWTGDGVALCSDLFEQYGAAIAPDGSGGAFVAWNDLRNGLEDIYGQHVTALGAIATGWPASGRAVCSAIGNQFDARVASDADGGAFFSWIDNRGAAQLDIYAQRVTGDGATAPGWPTYGVAVCSATGDQTVTAIVPDGAGGAIAAWYDLRTGNADIYALRFTGSGGSPPTVDVPPSPVSAFELFPAAPNPLRSQTWLRFRLATPERVTALIVDVAGRRVRQLLDGPSLPAGDHVIAWDGRDEAGTPVRGGVYLMILRAGAESATAKLAVLH
jgi:hypothetical protein